MKDMDVLVVIMLVVALLLVIGTLAAGLITMARGGDAGPRRSNLFMRYRVLFQGVAVLLFILRLAIAKG